MLTTYLFRYFGMHHFVVRFSKVSSDVPECRCADVRRIRELNENNTKKFIEERKRQAVMQSRQMELLRKLHTDHADKLRLEMNSVRRQIWGDSAPNRRGRLAPLQCKKTF